MPDGLQMAALAVLCLVACASTTAPPSQAPTCSPGGRSLADLTAWKAGDFVPPADADALALGLVDCLGDPEPKVRDGIAYEGAASLLRAGAVSEDARRTMIARLSSGLRANRPDPDGFAKPFAALVLSEVARTDRITPFLSAHERGALLTTATDYLRTVDDYRGFDATDGWRHGVAHGADLLMQLALNEALGADDHRAILAAVAAQVAPEGHFYIYGEPQRLARPLLFVAARATLTEAEWREWFMSLTLPDGPGTWDDAFSSQEKLADRHNTLALLQALQMTVSLTENADIRAMAPGLLEALREVPQ